MKPNLCSLTLGLVLLASSATVFAQTPPFAGGPKITCEQALAEAPKDDKSLLPLDKAYRSAEVAMKKKPKDAKLKKSFVEAAFKYGHFVTFKENALGPKVKYRAGLALYRKALAVDPKHAESLKEKKTIEDIYTTSLHLPIPN